MSRVRMKDRLAPWFKDRFLIEGVMPERALLRLKRAGISVFNVKKPQKNQILLNVSKKDSRKVFAIFPNVCYNIGEYTPYTARKIGAVGMGKYLEKLQKRVGLLLGALLFCATSLYLDGFVFGIECVGADTYAREAKIALEEAGIKPFARYKSGSEDLICAQLLRLERVAFCSVQKRGGRVYVEMQLSPFEKPSLLAGDMHAKRSGTLLSLTVLKGTPLKRAGEAITAGELLVGGYMTTESGESKAVSVIARAYIACTYESELLAANEEEAFAAAYLEIGFSDKDTITGKTIEQNGESFHVKIEYTGIETMNF